MTAYLIEIFKIIDGISYYDGHFFYSSPQLEIYCQDKFQKQIEFFCK